MQNYSVLMSVYHKEKPEYLRQAIESIQAQTLSTNDFVLVCDGPLNEPLDSVIAAKQQEMGESLNVVRLAKNGGLGNALNEGIKHAVVSVAKKLPMSKLAEPLKIYPQVLENVRVTDKKTAQNDPAVQEAVKEVAEALGDNGRILVRESGTEPVVRVMVEAPDHDTCQKYVDEVVNVICEKGYKA